MNRLIGDAKALGNSFFGILGGEPFMHPDLLDILAAHPDCYFQVFTNGQLITDEVAKRAAADRQRHAAGEHRRDRDHQRRAPRPQRRAQQDHGRACDACLRNKLLTGVAPACARRTSTTC